MENPFEIILLRLNNIEKAIDKLSVSMNCDPDILLSSDETCDLHKIKRTTLWKWSRNGKLTR